MINFFMVQSDGGTRRRDSRATEINAEFRNSEPVTVFEGDSDNVLFCGKAGRAAAYLAKQGIGDGTKVTAKF